METTEFHNKSYKKELFMGIGIFFLAFCLIGGEFVSIGYKQPLGFIMGISAGAICFMIGLLVDTIKKLNK
jgi:hypothetical protein